MVRPYRMKRRKKMALVSILQRVICAEVNTYAGLEMRELRKPWGPPEFCWVKPVV